LVLHRFIFLVISEDFLNAYTYTTYSNTHNSMHTDTISHTEAHTRVCSHTYTHTLTWVWPCCVIFYKTDIYIYKWTKYREIFYFAITRTCACTFLKYWEQILHFYIQHFDMVQDPTYMNAFKFQTLLVIVVLVNMEQAFSTLHKQYYKFEHRPWSKYSVCFMW